MTDVGGKPLPGMSSTLWVDDKGQILKSHTDMLGGMDTFRTTEAGTLGECGRAAIQPAARLGHPMPEDPRSREDPERRLPDHDGG